MSGKKPVRREVVIHGIDSEPGKYKAIIEDHGDGSGQILSMEKINPSNSQRIAEKKGGRCVGCRHFLFDPSKGHYQDEVSGWGECKQDGKATGFFSRCDKFEEMRKPTKKELSLKDIPEKMRNDSWWGLGMEDKEEGVD